MSVQGYAFNADHYCEKCMLDYARSVPYDEYVWGDHDSEDYRYSRNGLLNLMELVEDEIIRDNENNPIHPVFSTDEWYQIGEGNQTLNCNVCGAELDSYEEDED